MQRNPLDDALAYIRVPSGSEGVGAVGTLVFDLNLRVQVGQSYDLSGRDRVQMATHSLAG